MLDTAEGVRADSRSWNALLSAAAAASASAAQLTELMQQMRASNTLPDAATFSVVLSACARLGDAPTALALAAQMKVNTTVCVFLRISRIWRVETGLANRGCWRVSHTNGRSASINDCSQNLLDRLPKVFARTRGAMRVFT